MSQKDDSPETLFPMAEIESVWMACQGEFRRLSPLEWGYLESWLQNGISPTAIIEGIRETFRSFRPKYARDRIRSLVYCEQAIMRTAQEMSVADHWNREASRIHQEAQRAIEALTPKECLK